MSISNIGQTQGTRTRQNNGIDNRDLHIGLIHNPLINEFNLWLKGSAYVLQYHVRFANHLGNVVPFNYIMDKKVNIHINTRLLPVIHIPKKMFEMLHFEVLEYEYKCQTLKAGEANQMQTTQDKGKNMNQKKNQRELQIVSRCQGYKFWFSLNIYRSFGGPLGSIQQPSTFKFVHSICEEGASIPSTHPNVILRHIQQMVEGP